MSQVILEIPTIQGESAIENYIDMIICESLGQSAELEMEVSNNARRTFHSPKVNNISLSRKMDSASFGLLKNMLTAKVDTDDWKIHCLRGLGESDSMMGEFLTITLVKPIISNYTMEVNEGDSTESLEIHAVEIHWKYTPVSDTQEGSGQKEIVFNVLTAKVT